MNIRTIIDDVTRLASTVGEVLPQASIVSGVGDIANKVLDIIDAVKAHAPADQDLAHAQAQMEQARAALAARVKAHAARTSSDLRGNG